MDKQNADINTASFAYSVSLLRIRISRTTRQEQ